MKVLGISLDKKILDENSKNFQRQKEYAQLVDELHVVVFSKDPKQFSSGNLFIYGSGGNNKVSRFLGSHKKARQILKKKDLKDWLVTTQDPFFSGLLGCLLKRKFGIKLHVQVHGFEKFFGLRRLITKFVIPKADGFRVVSQRLKKRLVNEFGVKEGRITVVPIYTKKMQNAKCKNQNDNAKPKNNKFIFLTVGRLVAVKNIELQIKALAEVVKKYPNIELWIVGDGSEEKRLQATGYKLQVTKNIKFWGWQDNLEKFYKQADVFLLTSDYEGWGLVIIKAASFALPIIMTDVGCAGEVIRHRENGIIIPPGDQKALVEAMVKLIEDKELREKLGSNAQGAVSMLPSKEETLKLYKKSWQKALKN